MSRALSVLAATLVLAAGTGCSDDDGNGAAGGDITPLAAATASPAPEPADSTETRPQPAPDQSRWSSQVDAACRPLQGQIDAVPPPTDAAGLERWLAATLPLLRKQVAAVKAIKPPVKEEEARRVRLLVASLDKLESALTQYLAAIRLGDPKQVQNAVTAASVAGSAARGYAASLGITKCGGYSSE